MIVDFEYGTYIGDVNEEGLPHGKGMMKFGVYRDKSEKNYNYNEEILDGGFLAPQDGEIYSGEFVNGFAEGYGVYYLNWGERYEGEWSLGCEYGHGVYYYDNGDKFEGEWCEGYKEEGIYTYADGRKKRQVWGRKLYDEVLESEEWITDEDPQAPRSEKLNAPTSDEAKAIMSVISGIIKRYGTECFRKGGKANSFLTDLLPGDTNAKQRKRLRFAIESGACDILINGGNSRELLVNEAVHKLVDYVDMSEEPARETILILAECIL